MKRNLLIIILGFGFLILMGWLGGLLSSIEPHTPSAAEQNAQAGPYQITLQVNPNPPLLTRPAALTLQIVRKESGQLVSHAQVVVESAMVDMDMGTDRVNAQYQGNGLYLSHVQFTMSGPWGIRVLVTEPGMRTESASFEVTAQ
jgi:YtkA-like